MVMADTGRERQTTWDYMNKWTLPALPELQIIKASEWASNKGCIINDNRTILIPAYTTEDGCDIGKGSNFCTSYWKRDVIKKWLFHKHRISVSESVKWIGFSSDEEKRVKRMKKSSEFISGLIRFPLVELGIKRADAIKIVKDFGWDTPPRSNCWCCPNQTDTEWETLSTEEFKKAVILEKEMKKIDDTCFLHRSCVPLDRVKLFPNRDKNLGEPCDSGECFL
jgi:hypothetical protein